MPAEETTQHGSTGTSAVVEDPAKVNELILQRHNEVLAEQKLQPLISEAYPLSDVCNRIFNEMGGEAAVENPLVAKAATLATKKHYAGIRYVRRDGNCFLRGVLYGLLRHCIQPGASTAVRLSRLGHLEARVRHYRDALVQQFSDYVLDFSDVVLELLQSLSAAVRADNATSAGLDEILIRALCDADLSEYYVTLLRYIISVHIRENSEEFAPFALMGGEVEYNSMDEYCAAEVDVVGRDCDHVHITALVKALQVNIVVETIDASGGSETVKHEFCGLEDPGNVAAWATLLYRPGHYDIIVEE